MPAVLGLASSVCHEGCQNVVQGVLLQVRCLIQSGQSCCGSWQNGQSSLSENWEAVGYQIKGKTSTFVNPNICCTCSTVLANSNVTPVDKYYIDRVNLTLLNILLKCYYALF